MDTFGWRLRYLRKKVNDLSQMDLAQATNIPQTTISDWENDRGSPNVDELPRLASALNSTVSYLVEGVEEKSTTRKGA